MSTKEPNDTMEPTIDVSAFAGVPRVKLFLNIKWNSRAAANEVKTRKKKAARLKSKKPSTAAPATHGSAQPDAVHLTPAMGRAQHR